MIKNAKHFASFILLFSLFSFHLYAQDFSLVLDQTVDYNAHGEKFYDSKVDYTGTAIPQFYALLGDNAELVISLGLNYYLDASVFVPELLRTDFTMRFGGSELKVGRMPYHDPMGLVAEGLFDGLSFAMDTKAGTLSVGGWYTGLLYKERAVIEMTDDERKLRHMNVDYDNFDSTYFAPARMLTSLGWEHSALGGFIGMKLALLGQFDLTDADLHTQYFVAKFAIPLTNIKFDLGGSFELIEYSQDLTMALAGELGITWLPPGKIEQLISLRGIFTSGVVEDSTMSAFLPLTTVPQGDLLQTNIAGLSVISLDYIARLHRTFSANVTASYFVRSDLGTYKQYPVFGAEDSDGFALGAEFYGRLIWGISTELQMNLGVGTFLPSLGDASQKSDALWRAELNLVFLLF